MLPSDPALIPTQSGVGQVPASSENLSRADFVVTSEKFALLVLGVGFLVRLLDSWRFFLNPDEALHYLLASQSSLRLAYQAALTNAHPPLLILVLYYWRALGHSELMLRTPSILAGTATCWIVYQWLKLVTDRSTAFVGLLLLSFAPALIELSAEVRQYALLMFFMACCLYFSERALRENSVPFMLLFSFFLYGALLTHYSSLIFASTMGVYMLMRLYPFGARIRLLITWIVGQIGALALVTYYLVTHVARLKANGMPQGIAETWLRRSIFHPGENNVAVFIAGQTVRVFTYTFSHGLVGTLALLAFLAGIFSLLASKQALNSERPTPRELALLIGLPFVVNCAVALAGLYPYGGTRHNSYLVLFAISGISIGLAIWSPRRVSVKILTVIAALAVCNVFPAPPPLIRARNHSRALMNAAMASLKLSAAPGSVIFGDHESGLILGYYACGHGIVQVFPPYQPYSKADCGPYTVISTRPQEWKFYAEDLPTRLAAISQTYGLSPGSKLWLFNAGWITDSTPALIAAARPFGCSQPKRFGENIFFCEVNLDSQNVHPPGSQ